MRRVGVGVGKPLTRSRQSLLGRCKVAPWDEDGAQSRVSLSSVVPGADPADHISGLSSGPALSSNNCWPGRVAGCLRPRTWNARGSGGCAMPCAGAGSAIGRKSWASSCAPVKTAAPMGLSRPSLTCAALSAHSRRSWAGIGCARLASRAWPRTCDDSRSRASTSAALTASLCRARVQAPLASSSARVDPSSSHRQRRCICCAYSGQRRLEKVPCAPVPTKNRPMVVSR
jgi:hypothetical protein